MTAQTQRSLLNSVIQKFKFEELESAVLPEFPEITWDQVRSCLIRNHESFTTFNVVKIINRVIREMKLTEKDLKSRISHLEVIEISRHPDRKMWHAYELKNRKDNFFNEYGPSEIQNSMLDYFNGLQMEMHIKSEVYNDITFIIIREKKSHRLAPICIALFLEQDLFFCSNKSVTKEFLLAVVQSTGYSECKKLLLSGKNITSLIKIRIANKRNAIDENDMSADEEFEEAPGVVTNMGIDFKQNQHRRNYLSKYLGSDDITLDSLVIKNRNVPLADPKFAAKFPDFKLNIQWEFKSANMKNFLCECTDQRVLTMPLPDYAKHCFKSGKNELTVLRDRYAGNA